MKNGNQESTLSLSERSLLEAPPKVILPLAASFIVLIAIVDNEIHSNVSLGLLYVIPILMLALVLDRIRLVALAALCAVMREQFGPYLWDAHSFARISSAVAVFGGAGFFVGELVRSRRLALLYGREVQQQNARREAAENQVRMLVETSPAAIVTLDANGRVVLANQAAHELLAVPPGSLDGASIGQFLPTVADLLATGGDQPYRSATNCRGKRSNGESFLACVWFATYPTSSGRHMAAIITDTSEDLRDWQETSLQSMLRSTRVLVGSVSHEIRNMCAAISVVHANLGRLPGVAGTEDYSALGTLAQGLTRLVTVELQSSADHPMESVNLDQLLDEFRIVVAPSIDAAEAELRIIVPPSIPPVAADRHGLLQVLLNLCRNSLRAVEGFSPRRISILASADPDWVLLRFTDSGPGVTKPDRLFQPFQAGAEAVGLGLFVSRAIVRACGGELYHEPSARGCTMCLRLKPIETTDLSTETSSSEIPA